MVYGTQEATDPGHLDDGLALIIAGGYAFLGSRYAISLFGRLIITIDLATTDGNRRDIHDRYGSRVWHRGSRVSVDFRTSGEAHALRTQADDLHWDHFGDRSPQSARSPFVSATEEGSMLFTRERLEHCENMSLAPYGSEP